MPSRRRLTAGVLVLLFFPFVWWSQVRAAPLPCAKRDQMAASLARMYGEHLVAAGLSGAGLAIEVFASADGATFTILRSWPNGVSCILDHGENWRPEASQPEDRGPRL